MYTFRLFIFLNNKLISTYIKYTIVTNNTYTEIYKYAR